MISDVKYYSSEIPKTFLCTVSHSMMEFPYLGLGDCGHLFDASVFAAKRNCPLDGMPLTPDNCLALPQLAEKITKWKKENPLPEMNGKITLAQKLKQADPNGKSAQTAPKVQPLETIKNAHDDDIHGFLRLSPGVFVSGSKDNTVKLWDANEKNKTVLNSSWKTKGYVYWVTALAKLDDAKFASGTRDGYLSVWNLKGDELKSFQYAPSKNTKDETVSKERNKQRINCIAANKFGDQSLFFTGTPKFIQLWDSNTGGMRKNWKADNNDWVYCIEPLKEDTMITVIGSRMELWSSIYEKFPKIEPLIQEKKEFRKQRPHISAIVRLESNPDLLPCALFDGSVRVVNIRLQTVEKIYQEHKGRVWSVIELQPQIIASSADDKTIKIWDLRCNKSVLTLGGAPGRVSSLLKINDTQFISGSCPDDVHKSPEKGLICFWDIKQVLSAATQFNSNH